MYVELDREDARKEYKQDLDIEQRKNQLEDKLICDLLEYYPAGDLEELRKEIIDTIAINGWCDED